MSLFNVCNWWTAQCPDLDENYDVASLLCARFGLEDQEKDYIVVGSHTGQLSIFYPSYEQDANGNCPGYKPTDLLLEIQGQLPILGVYAGRFSANNRKENANQLALLHPNSLAIYNIVHVGGVAEHGAQLSLKQISEYRFQRTAFSFCKGHFGKVKGREFFCVVHLDGSLTFFEQDGISYECKFPGHRALPTPVVYCERTDSFFRLASAWNLECYTYQDLSHSSINKSHYQPIWSVCLGEGILDMNVVQVKSDYASLMILGEHNFICLTDTGKIEFILKLDYAPKCFHSFVVGYYWEPTARLITIIVSETSKVFIYEMANIIWAAQFKHESPVAIQRSNIMNLPGGIVTLSPTGKLRIGYLGSDPYIFQVPPLNMQELTFQQAHDEFIQLEQEIKEATDIQDMKAINEKAYADVHIEFAIEQNTNDDADTMLLDIPAHVTLKDLPVCSGKLKWHAKCDLSELQVVFNLPDGIKCSQDTLTYTDIKADTREIMELDFYTCDLLHIPSAKVEAIVSFISTKGIPRVIQKTSFLPLNMFFKARQPQKAAAIKLTFNVNAGEESVKLTNYFTEFVSWESDIQALGLVLLTTADESQEEIITIVAAKNSNRIRIQSDYLETFPLIMERLMEKSLEMQNSKESNEKSQKLGNILQATPFIPAQPILHRIDVHHETQENIRKQTLELDELWQKFKDLQRKLQEKSDDEPKESLVMQIEENYDHLIAEGDKLMEMRKDELRQRCDLSCALVVAKIIISCLNLEEKIVKVVSSVLTTPTEDWTELSWEESMAAGIDMLHHYGPLNRSKNSNTQNNMIDATASQDTFDYTRFRKHFATFFDRIVRLASNDAKQLAGSSSIMEVKTESQPVAQKVEIENKPDLTMETWHDILNVKPMQSTTGAVKRLKPFQKSTTLEAVEDDEEDADDDDAEDLRKMGYKKEYGCKEKRDDNESEWLNEDFKLPSSEELFSDLGIWW
ncbi:protein PTHB1-like [Musca vetustissima]|uniref:protein PTHB1-like n=1 Tax=Musca vetustissima TaxID=27455 RepID=UPI002AB6E6DC|nr:protein PTHB1-like [Musca vetustissima]